MKVDLISRPELERQLRDAVGHTALTLLFAPLGAGKTATATMVFADVPGVVWIEAQPWHREGFMRDLVAGVRSERADFGRMTLGSLDAGASAMHIGSSFARELGHIDEPLTIIVDNAHLLAGGPDFAHFIDAAIRELPPSVHILAMGRSLPEMPIAQAFASGRAQLFDNTRLAFGADEIRALSRNLGRAIDDNELQAIESNTQGWATGVTLALTAGRTPLLTAKGPRDAAELYLTKELLSSLDRRATAFLERIAVFEIVDVHMLEKTPAFADAAGMMTVLRRSGAPLTEIAPGRYRLHPVLRELAAARLHRHNAAGTAHRDAAQAYLHAGEIAAALFHADEAADPEIAGSFLRSHATSAIATGERARIRALVSRIDPRGPDADVGLYCEALLKKVSGETGVRETLLRAIAAADTSKDETVAFHARAQAIEYDLGKALPVEDAAFEELLRRGEPLGGSAVASALVMRGWSHAVARDFHVAVAIVAPLIDADDPAVRFNADILRAYALTALGDAGAAEETLDALIALLENDDKVVLQTLTLVWFARLALLWGHSNAAGDAAAQAERLASALQLRTEEAALYVALAEVATHHGDIDATVRYAQRARESADRAWYAGDVGRIGAFAEIALARAAFLARDNALARDLAERVAARADAPAVQRAVASAESAVYTLLCEPQAAPASIERARQALNAALPFDAADAIALSTADDLLAFLDAANGEEHAPLLVGCEPFAGLIERHRGLVTLEHAGLAVGSVRRGTSDGPAAFDAAIDLLTRAGPRFEVRLARAYASSFIRPKRSVAPLVILDLTPREHEILVLLVEGLTNKEIAQRLIVSPRTVETHVERVLGKLEVGSRSRAIAKAIRLGIVSLDSGAQ